MLLRDIVDTSGAVRGTRSRKAKTGRLAECIRRLGADELDAGVAYLYGALPHGRIGVGWAAIKEAREVAAAGEATLSVGDVDRTLRDIAGQSGSGSGRERKRLLGQLFSRATADEQEFLSRLLIGELRQGASEGVMADAVAAAADVPAADVRRALMLSGDLSAVTRAAMTGGAGALSAFRIQLFRPLQPMLASPAEDIDAALAVVGEAAVELKLDGARVQVHKDGDEVRVYSRRLNEVTPALPELVEAVRGMPARRLILDGEAIALKPDGTPHPFQTTMSRFGRRVNVDDMRASLPLSTLYFDCLLVDDDDLIDRPGTERVEALAGAVGDAAVPRIVTADPAEVEAFWDDALARGHEGVMVKALDAAYEAGRRGKTWLKLKPAHTLDLVVIGIEWGSGRRQGWLSNLHLGARDPRDGSFVMVGKTFKGMTDAMLEWQTKRFLELETYRDGHIVWVRPEQVVEIALSDVQVSPHYPGGVALRFARVKRYRDDKTAAQADTIDRVRELLP